MFELKGKRVWIAGHRGMVGSALLRRLAGTEAEVLTADRLGLDLRDQPAVKRGLTHNRPDAVFIGAATVGRVGGDRERPAGFFCNHLMIDANIVHAGGGDGVSE